jgi:chromosome segregation ATPase
MARGGVNKVLVLKARDALVARGEHPSIDAVRIEMGNTGSKTTIHRYLRELDSSAQPVRELPPLTQALTELVAKLAAQIEEDGRVILEQGQAVLDAEARQCREHAEQADMASEAAQAREAATQKALDSTGAQLLACQAELQAQQTSNARLVQACSDLDVRLNDQLQRVASLEEQHRHARDALAHYRTSVREQREQEQRRHEGQVQMIQVEVRQLQQAAVVRQDQVTRLNRDNERLLAESVQSDRANAAQGHALERERELRVGLETQVGQQRETLAEWQRRAAQAEGAQQALAGQLAALNEQLKAQQALWAEAGAAKAQAKKRPPSAGKAARGVSPKD